MATQSKQDAMGPGEHDFRSELAPFENIQDGLDRLTMLAHSLKVLGQVNARIAIVTLVVLVLAGLSRAVVQLINGTMANAVPAIPIVLSALLIAGIMSSVWGIVELLVWDRRRRLGIVFYTHLSDALEWQHRLGRENDDKHESQSDGAKIRSLFREFLSSATLPLMRDDSSAAGYLTFHVVCIIVFVEMIFLLL